MLTGDNARTAASIARQCGILPAGTDLDAVIAAGRQLASKEPSPSSAASHASVCDRALSDPPGPPLVLEAPLFRRLVTRPDGTLDTQAFK
jgi:hypothetical protein